MDMLANTRFINVKCHCGCELKGSVGDKEVIGIKCPVCDTMMEFKDVMVWH